MYMYMFILKFDPKTKYCQIFKPNTLLIKHVKDDKYQISLLKFNLIFEGGVAYDIDISPNLPLKVLLQGSNFFGLCDLKKDTKVLPRKQN